MLASLLELQRGQIAALAALTWVSWCIWSYLTSPLRKYPGPFLAGMFQRTNMQDTPSLAKPNFPVCFSFSFVYLIV